MVTAERFQRMCVWPGSVNTRTVAAAQGCDCVAQLTVWDNETDAAANVTFEEEGGGEAYVAEAVHFDGATYLENESLIAPDEGTFSFSAWIKIASAQAGNTYSFTTGIVGDYSYFTAFVTYTAGWMSATLYGSGGTSFSIYSEEMEPIVPDVWHHVLVSFDCNHAAGLKVGKLYVDDVNQAITVSDIHPAFTIETNANLFRVIADLDGEDLLIGDIADLWVSSVSLLTAGDIPEANRRKFIDAEGKPVDPSNFPAGFCLFSGNASTFATNQGSGGAFTLTGSLTNASTSPSD